jgi:hypothetical protein
VTQSFDDLKAELRQSDGGAAGGAAGAIRREVTAIARWAPARLETRASQLAFGLRAMRRVARMAVIVFPAAPNPGPEVTS